MTFRESLHRRAAESGGTVVLIEGWDERVQEAGANFEKWGIGTALLLSETMAGDPRVPKIAELLRSRRPDKVAIGRASKRLRLIGSPVSSQ